MSNFSVGAQPHKQLLALMEQIVGGKGRKEDGGETQELAKADGSETCFISVGNTMEFSSLSLSLSLYPLLLISTQQLCEY